MQDILTRLAEGDMRTTGAADTVAREIGNDQVLFDVVFRGLFSDDPGLRMRCSDVLEKVSKIHPELLKPYKSELLDEASSSEQQEVQWHVAQMIPRLQLNGSERRRAVTMMERYFSSKSKFVRVGALQAIVELAEQDESIKKLANIYLQKALNDPSHAVQARARNLIQK